MENLFFTRVIYLLRSLDLLHRPIALCPHLLVPSLCLPYVSLTHGPHLSARPVRIFWETRVISWFVISRGVWLLHFLTPRFVFSSVSWARRRWLRRWLRLGFVFFSSALVVASMIDLCCSNPRRLCFLLVSDLDFVFPLWFCIGCAPDPGDWCYLRRFQVHVLLLLWLITISVVFELKPDLGFGFPLRFCFGSAPDPSDWWSMRWFLGACLLFLLIN